MKFRISFLLMSAFLISLGLIVFGKRCDLFVTSLFYDYQGFYFKNNVIVDSVDKYIEYVACILYAFCVGVWLLRRVGVSVKVLEKFNFIDTVKVCFLSVCFFGWCVAFPYAFKIFFHRPRPYQTDVFGGEFCFVRAFEKSSYNIGDSFISGHTSIAMWLVSLALILPEKIRKVFCFFALTVVCLVAVGRVLGGYHYLTDVYFAMLLVGSCIWLTYQKMLGAENYINGRVVSAM